MKTIILIRYYWLYTRLCKAVLNTSLANSKLSKTQLHNIGRSRGFLGRLLGPLLKTGLPLTENVLKPLAKRILIPLGLMAAASATNWAIYEKMFQSGFTTLIISDEKMEGIIRTVTSLDHLSLFIKDVSETIQNEAKKQKGGFLSKLLGTIGVSLLGNLLTRKGTIRAGEETIRAGQKF